MSANTATVKIDLAVALNILGNQDNRLYAINHGSTTPPILPIIFPQDIQACEYDPDAMERVKQFIKNCESLSPVEGRPGVMATTMRFALLLQARDMSPAEGPLMLHTQFLDQMLLGDPNLMRCYLTGGILFDCFNRSLLAMDVLLQRGANPNLAIPYHQPSVDDAARTMPMLDRSPELLARVIWEHNDDQIDYLRGLCRSTGGQAHEVQARLITLKLAIQLRNAKRARNEALLALAGAGTISRRPGGPQSTAARLVDNDGDKRAMRRIVDILDAPLDPIREPLYIQQKTAYLDWLIRGLTAIIPNYADRPEEREQLKERRAKAQKELHKLRALQPQPQPAPGGHAPGGGPPGP